MGFKEGFKFGIGYILAQVVTTIAVMSVGITILLLLAYCGGGH